jgi:hypothetical protein
MKTKIKIVLLVALAASFISVRAEDNPSQAAARAALVKKLFDLDRSQPQTSSNWDSGVVATRPAPFTNQIAKPVVTNTPPPVVAVAIQPAPAPTNKIPPAVAPVKTVPAAARSTPRLAVVPITPPPAPPKPNTNQIKLLMTSAPALPDSALVTTTGAIYHNAQVERVETNALIISYVPAGGGTAMTRVYFEDLPADVRARYEKK